jgi:DNA-binding MarR family transcriptional regulator
MNNNFQESLGSLLSKANLYTRAYFNSLIKNENLNITIEQWVLLSIVSQNPGITQTEIAKIGLKDKTNVTRILDVLEKNNLTVRKSDKNNRRIYKIFLTSDGERNLIRMNSLAKKVEEAAANIFSEKELHELKKSLKKICTGLEKIIKN